MSDWIARQLALLGALYPELEYLKNDHWVRLDRYEVPAGWSAATVELAFRIPDSEAIPPYGFWVRPHLLLAGRQMPSNYTHPVTTGFGEDWGQFSWSPVAWRPTADGAGADTIVHFVRSFQDRLLDLS